MTFITSLLNLLRSDFASIYLLQGAAQVMRVDWAWGSGLSLGVRTGAYGRGRRRARMAVRRQGADRSLTLHLLLISCRHAASGMVSQT